MAWRRLALLLALGLPAAACQAEPERAGGRGSLGDTLNRAGRTGPASVTPSRQAPTPTAVVPAAAADLAADGEPGQGSPQRRAILDALRPAIETALRSPVEFVVRRIGVQDGWALIIADPQRPGGGAIDAGHLDPEEERDGLTVNAILRFSNNRWNLVDHAIGPTDVWYCGYQGPPPALLGC